MNYVTTDSISLVYTIQKGSTKNTANQYHIEVHNVSTGTKAIVNSPAVVAATTEAVGTATFGTVSLPNTGAYLITVFYAGSADLDGASVSVESLATASVYKVASVTSIAI